MKIQVRDNQPEPGYGSPLYRGGVPMVAADVDDWRHAEMTNFVRRSGIFPVGSGANYGRASAQDAGEAESFAIGQLTYLEQKAFARWYQPMHYEQVLAGCIDYSAGPQAKAVNYLISDRVGIGKRMSPGANDVPLVDVAYALKAIPVQSGGIGYDYTQEDLRTSAFLKQPLSNTKQVAAVEAYKRHMNFVALQGESLSNLTGLYNATGVTAANRTSGAVWDSATADTIINDIIVAYSAYYAATGSNLRPTKIIFPATTRQLLFKPRSTVSDTTIERFITETLKVEISDDIALETLGSGSTKRVVFLNAMNDNVVFHIPMPLQFLAPQLQGFRVVVPAEYKYGGLEVRRVQSVRYMDGV